MLVQPCVDSLITTVEMGRALECRLECTIPDPLAQLGEQGNYRGKIYVSSLLFVHTKGYLLL